MNPSSVSIPSSPSASTSSVAHNGISYSPYTSELELPLISSLIEKELSEPYIIYTYRYFLNQWPQLCWIAREPPASAPQDHEGSASVPASTGVGVIVCKLDRHLKGERKLRGYIAMLSVAPSHRGKGIASHLVKLAMAAMIKLGAEEVVLETEADNEASLGLYERLGFMREKRLHSFYLNGERETKGRK